MHSTVTMHASILESKQTVKHTLGPKTTRAYVHLIMKSGYRKPESSAQDKYEDGGAMLKVNGGLILEEGDGAFVAVKTVEGVEGDRVVEFSNVAEREAEFLLFEME